MTHAQHSDFKRMTHMEHSDGWLPITTTMHLSPSWFVQTNMTDTQTYRHTGHTDIQTHRHTWHTEHVDTQTHRHTDTQITHRHTDTHRHTQTHRHTDTRTHRHTDRDTNTRHTTQEITHRHKHRRSGVMIENQGHSTTTRRKSETNDFFSPTSPESQYVIMSLFSSGSLDRLRMNVAMRGTSTSLTFSDGSYALWYSSWCVLKIVIVKLTCRICQLHICRFQNDVSKYLHHQRMCFVYSYDVRLDPFWPTQPERHRRGWDKIWPIVVLSGQSRILKRAHFLILFDNRWITKYFSIGPNFKKFKELMIEFYNVDHETCC